MRSTTDRILGLLKGLACGDAIGKQTEGLSRDGVLRWYPDGVRGFEGVSGIVIPRYAGNVKRKWKIGETTDDTEHTIAVAHAILEDGDVRHSTVGRKLLACTKCVHPGIKSLWEFHQAGDPDRVTQHHNGCGAAVRVSPVGVLYCSDRLDEIVEGSREASISTHGGALALGAAAATAAAVSAAIDGASRLDIIELARRAASRAERQRSGSKSSEIANAIAAIYADLRCNGDPEPAAVAARFFPDQPLTIVPLAIAIAAVMRSAEEAILLAANIGGDSDSVASIAGAILGARYPHTVNKEWYETVEAVNGYSLAALGGRLSQLRR
jgi:ADP-ribosylglycohydrolase